MATEFDKRMKAYECVSRQYLTRRVSVLRSDITALRTENVAHVQKYKESPEVKEAVKYAMKSAHPDNGGDAKDFMKFRELYNKIK